jgi:hypothetical protein
MDAAEIAALDFRCELQPQDADSIRGLLWDPLCVVFLLLCVDRCMQH